MGRDGDADSGRWGWQKGLNGLKSFTLPVIRQTTLDSLDIATSNCKWVNTRAQKISFYQDFLLSFGSWWLGSLFNNSSGDSFALHSRNLEILPFFHLLSLILPILIKQAKQDGNVSNVLAAAPTMHVNWWKNLQSIYIGLGRILRNRATKKWARFLRRLCPIEWIINSSRYIYIELDK